MTGQLELLVFAYPDETSADESLKKLKKLKKDGLIDIVNAAVIVKDEKGKVHAKETADPGAKQGALFGAVVGGLIGLIGGPAGVVIGAAAGAGTGGVAAKKIDMGIPLMIKSRSLPVRWMRATQPSLQSSTTPGSIKSWQRSKMMPKASCDRP